MKNKVAVGVLHTQAFISPSWRQRQMFALFLSARVECFSSFGGPCLKPLRHYVASGNVTGGQC